MGYLRNPYKTDPQTWRHHLGNLGVDILYTIIIKIYLKECDNVTRLDKLAHDRILRRAPVPKPSSAMKPIIILTS